MELKVKLLGEKKVSTQIRDHVIETDQPIKGGGADSAPAPFDLFLASIVTCVGFYVQSYCQSKGFDTDGIEISMTTRRDPKTKGITGFRTRIALPAHLPDKLDAALQRVAEQCAVKKTIRAVPDFIVETVRV